MFGVQIPNSAAKQLGTKILAYQARDRVSQSPVAGRPFGLLKSRAVECARVPGRLVNELFRESCCEMGAKMGDGESGEVCGASPKLPTLSNHRRLGVAGYIYTCYRLYEQGGSQSALPESYYLNNRTLVEWTVACWWQCVCCIYLNKPNFVVNIIEIKKHARGCVLVSVLLPWTVMHADHAISTCY